ncbi:MAG: DUF4293 domain-containing protein [Dysgonamonadaceae bacterium]|jgi:peptidoglycan/LPS O-acetylase OafA/YrhL|nr:DUF4293 domain-containing protein [Dysgonamonadaceae bacterium]
MIQRIQSVYLLLAAILLLAMFFLSLSKENAAGFYLSALFAIDGITALLAIFLFKNRKRQMRITVASVLISAGLSGGFIARSQDEWIYMAASLIAAVLAAAALSAIRKDEKLVRSLDRLR